MRRRTVAWTIVCVVLGLSAAVLVAVRVRTQLKGPEDPLPSVRINPDVLVTRDSLQRDAGAGVGEGPTAAGSSLLDSQAAPQPEAPRPVHPLLQEADEVGIFPPVTGG